VVKEVFMQPTGTEFSQKECQCISTQLQSKNSEKVTTDNDDKSTCIYKTNILKLSSIAEQL